MFLLKIILKLTFLSKEKMKLAPMDIRPHPHEFNLTTMYENI